VCVCGFLDSDVTDAGTKSLFIFSSNHVDVRHTRTRLGAKHHVCDEHDDHDADDVHFRDERSTRANDGATNLWSEDPSDGGCGGR